MQRSEAWLDYFRKNADRPSPPLPAQLGDLAPRVKGELVRSLGRFYLGETGEGRIAREAVESNDPVLDAAACESLALYIREEGRHARELAAMIRALGAPLPKRHWSESLFRRGRRMLGFRTKMMTITVAEVIGLAYYGVLADNVPPLADAVLAIAADERQHLAFQAEYFGAVFREGGLLGTARRALGAFGFVAITACGVTVFAVDHAPLFRVLGVRAREVVARCATEAGRAVLACAVASRRSERPDDPPHRGRAADAAVPSGRAGDVELQARRGGDRRGGPGLREGAPA